MQQLLSRVRTRGFTIVELLIVIVVIGILAAITILAYNGVQSGARDNAVVSDLEGVATEVTHYQVNNNGVFSADGSGSSVTWYSGSGANSNITFSPSSGDIVDVVANNTDYCIRGYNPGAKTYSTLATAAKKESTSGICATLGPSVAALAAGGPYPNMGVVTTLAGSGASGSANGTGTAATFSYPTGATIDPLSGSLYVIEANNVDIRKVTTAGVVTTIASSLPGSPWGVTINPAGTLLYYTDTYGDAIRQVTTAGVSSLFAGGTYGTGNGTGAAAQFSRTIDVASDSGGNVYVADMDNNLIRAITPGAVVTTLAGSSPSGFVNGTGAGAKFSTPYGLAVDSSGNVYVADMANNAIRKITPGGVVTTLAGSGVAGSANGTGTAAQFRSPNNVAVDSSGNVYVTDNGNNLVRMITPAGVVTTLAGSGTAGSGNGSGTAAQFRGLSGIAVTSSGTVYVTETTNNDIRKIQ